LRYLIQNSSIYFRNFNDLPFSLHLNEDDLILEKGKEFHLFVYGINKRVSFTSTNFRVAGVNFNGRIMAYQTGKAFIIAKVDGEEIKCRVRVIDLNKNKLTLKVGKSYSLKVNGIVAIPSWKSSNPKVASVSMFGNVTAKSPGSTIITAKVKGKEIKCKVQVIDK
jgi:uncharacterized protein YjdB